MHVKINSLQFIGLSALTMMMKLSGPCISKEGSAQTSPSREEHFIEEEIKINPPPYQDKDEASLSQEQKEKINQYWQDLNNKIVHKLEQISPQKPLEEILNYVRMISQEQRAQINALGKKQKQYSHSSSSPDSFSSPIESVSLETLNRDRFEWSLFVAKLTNPYFSAPYKNAPNDFLTCPEGSQRVYRPNHSLAHGMRQAYLAVDLITAFKNAHFSTQDSPTGKVLQEWIQQRLKKDPNFLRKVEFANAFQRSGRQSEIGRSENPQLYDQYLLNDQQNFQKAAEEQKGKLFDDDEEINLFCEAITQKFVDIKKSETSDLMNLSRVLYTADLLDLRRLHTFNKQKIIENISFQLFQSKTPHPWEKQFIEKLWAPSGGYLAATGDRDMEDLNKRDYDIHLFCEQAHSPDSLVKSLQLARTRPQDALFSSILSHTQAMRELKEKSGETKAIENPFIYTPHRNKKNPFQPYAKLWKMPLTLLQKHI